uniref:Uncharacterized protein n=1 Tax=Anopheles darlingi TaxID=43151 RepID=A0A2M4D0N3_ANODA
MFSSFFIHQSLFPLCPVFLLSSTTNSDSLSCSLPLFVYLIRTIPGYMIFATLLFWFWLLKHRHCLVLISTIKIKI